MHSPNPTTLSRKFPPHFRWGVATAAYQIEGAVRTDGRGPSIWDVFCERPGRVAGGQSGAVACEHYHRWREDVALLRELGVNAYRFSIAWSRVLPDGRSPVNARGLEFYDRLVDELLAANIQPLVTLYHWDLPWELHCQGGWLNRDCAGWFSDYASLVATKLGDRVRDWCTFNEMPTAAGIGYHTGQHAPGLNVAPREYFRLAHHLNLAHGRGARAVRTHARRPARISQAFNCNCRLPASDAPAAVRLAAETTFGFDRQNPWTSTHLWIDPVLKGEYSAEVREFFGDALSIVQNGDIAEMTAPLDYFGWNFYMDWANPQTADGSPVTQLKWRVQPEGLYWGPRFFHERYGLPIEILENGVATTDWVAADGSVPDHQRIDYITRHLDQLSRAMRDGVTVEAYYHWSFLDNFEWAEGYLPRFGLVHVDYGTQRRTPKASALWYRDFIRQQTAHLDD